MVSEFPNFTPLTIEHKSILNTATEKFLPYSDFNFVSLHSWDTEEKIQISYLHDNLIVLFIDYMTNEPFLTFIGDNKMVETLDTLFKYAKEHDLVDELRLIGEEIAQKIILIGKYEIFEDRDSFDYLVDSQMLSELKGKHHASRRHGVNNFKKNNPHHVLKRLEINEETKASILSTFKQWQVLSDKHDEDAAKELIATQRLLDNSHKFDLETLGIYVDNRMVAYSIYEILPNGYAMGHFEKAHKNHFGLYDYLKHKTSENLYKNNVKTINYEQDLGIEALRTAKMHLRPSKLLKKYTIRLKDTS